MYELWGWRKRPEVQIHPQLHIEFWVYIVYMRHSLNKQEHTRNMFWKTPSTVLGYTVLLVRSGGSLSTHDPHFQTYSWG